MGEQLACHIAATEGESHKRVVLRKYVAEGVFASTNTRLRYLRSRHACVESDCDQFLETRR